VSLRGRGKGRGGVPFAAAGKTAKLSKEGYRGERIERISKLGREIPANADIKGEEKESPSLASEEKERFLPKGRALLAANGFSCSSGQGKKERSGKGTFIIPSR